MELAEMVATGDEDLASRGVLIKAAAGGDADAQRELRWRYDVWVYSPGERDAFVQRRGMGRHFAGWKEWLATIARTLGLESRL